MSLDIRPCNDEDVANIVHLILPYLPQAECTGTHSQFASINVETKIPAIAWCWQMHGRYMSFRPQGFPHGHIEFRATIYSPEEMAGYRTAKAAGHAIYDLPEDAVVSQEMIDAYNWVRDARGHSGKNRVSSFFPKAAVQPPASELQLVPKKPTFLQSLARFFGV